ncbi:MAG: DUF5077 domain-containing protein [Chitinophagales bacterium]
MKRTKNLFKLVTLLSVIFVLSCQKNDSISPGNGTGSKGGGLGPTIPPINTDLLIPLAGNAYVTEKAAGGTESITSNGLENWTSTSAVTSTFFRVAVTGLLDVKVKAMVPTGTSSIKVTVNGTPFTISVTGNTYKTYTVGTVNITKVGYVKVDLQGVSKTGSTFATVSDLAIAGTPALVDVVYANDAANFASARKGPVVQLQYSTPGGSNTEWFYSEIVIPNSVGRNGSKFNANVFNGGSVGIELTASGEKRMSFTLQNPIIGSISLIRTGASVAHTTSASGEYIYMPFNWSDITKYKFLTQAKPDGNGNTIYTSWFYSPETSEWLLLASCNKPNTISYLKNISSSIEGTTPENSFLARKARYMNQWIKDTNGNWSELTQATFIGDNTADNKQRQDYASDVDADGFAMRSNGFFADYTALQTTLSKPASGIQPSVDLNSLP